MQTEEAERGTKPSDYGLPDVETPRQEEMPFDTLTVALLFLGVGGIVCALPFIVMSLVMAPGGWPFALAALVPGSVLLLFGIRRRRKRR